MTSLIDEGAPPPCPAPFNMAAHVLARAADLPRKIALEVVRRDGNERWSYEELERAVLGTAGALIAAGARPGERVLLRLGNSVDFPVVYLACLAVDLVPVPISAQLTRAEIARIVQDTAPVLIAADETLAMPVQDAPLWGLDALARARTHAPATYAMGDPNRPGYIIYTSGSGGHPRAVVHAHRAIWARRMMWRGWYGLDENDRLLHAGAFNWTYTLGTGLMDPWAYGATALIPAPGTGSGELPLLLQKTNATIFASTPGVYRQILKCNAKFDTPRLRHGLSAGEKLPQTTRAAWESATGTSVHEALGMTECSTFISGSPARPAPAGATGYAQTGRRVAVLGADDSPAPRGEAGMLAVSRRDPGLMLGYLDRARETATRFAGEWFVTGDTVSMADDGAITYLGRHDDMMNAGGYRVSPLEVEEALRPCPGVADCAAAEVNVKADTRVIAAFYTGPQPLSEAELQCWLAPRLARYKQPRIFQHVTALPKGANGKLLRKRLSADYEAPHDQT